MLLSLHLSKCHIVGNHMPWLIIMSAKPMFYPMSMYALTTFFYKGFNFSYFFSIH